MRQGNRATLLWDNKGHLVAISTGSDACAEHECGSMPILQALTNVIEQDEQLVKALQRGQPVVYPSLLEQRRITHPEKLQFIETPVSDKGTCEAFFGLARHPLTEYQNDLCFPSRAFRRDENIDVVGAWDEESFALRVRSQKLVEALRSFYEGVCKGHGIFAGLFLKGEPFLGGVIIADERYLTESHLESLGRAQAEYESKLRLKARDDSGEVLQQMRKVHPKGNDFASHPGYLWAVWADKQESEVLYALNPGYRIPAGYYGPYTRQQLLDWAASGYAYELGREKAATA